jgi:hypothetical protein
MRTVSQPLPGFAHALPARTLSCDPAPGAAGAHAHAYAADGGCGHAEGALHRGGAPLDDVMW